MTCGLVLYAPNVHTGGGLVLLRSLLASWPGEGGALTVFLDARARESLTPPQGSRVFWVVASARGRLRAEFELQDVVAREGGVIFCFHGLPPVLPTRAEVIVFQQNRNYLGLNALSDFAWKTRIRLLFERLISRAFRSRVSRYIVQTRTMEREVRSWLGGRGASPAIEVLPFVGGLPGAAEPQNPSPDWDFVYVADGEAHKNHRRLMEAWELLAEEGLRPSLALTLGPRDERLRVEVAAVTRRLDLKITDLGQMPHDRILALYANARALIFPSTSESFGLPLIEAEHMGLPIVAGELDYVRDVCTPCQTFDPDSPVSIARAVKRFLGVNAPREALRSPSEFWASVLRGCAMAA